MTSDRLKKKVRSLTTRLPLSKKLAYGYGFSLFILLSGFGYFLLETFHQAIHENYDWHLRFEAKELISYIDVSKETLTVNTTELDRIEALNSIEYFATYVRIFNIDYSLIYQSSNFIDIEEPLIHEFPNNPSITIVSNNWQSLPGRTLFYPVVKNNGDFAGWLEVTGFEWSLHEDLNDFTFHLLLLIILGVTFAIITSYWLSKLALSPIISILNTAKSITATDLDKRITLNHQVQDELTDLTETLNMMLNRLQKSFDREKRFTSDAAHEFLTPFSTLLNDAEIILRKPRTIEDYKKSIERMLIEVKRLIKMVHLLLQLSKVESIFNPETEIVNISRITEVELEKWMNRANEKSIRLHPQITSDILIPFQEAYAIEIVNNLLDNAIKYTPKDGKIYLKLRLNGNRAVLQITDTGIGFDESKKPYLFERFYRVDDPVVQKETGNGLGLPLIKAILELYNGNIRAFSDGLGNGSTFIAEFLLRDEIGS
jgi:signal transduction histidine kinase